MVGVPVAAILGVLELGRGLRAPAAIGGRWGLVPAAPATDGLAPCLDAVAAAPHVLRVSQSGRYVEARLRRAGARAGIALRGVVESDRLALGTEARLGVGCDGPLQLSARIVQKDDGRMLDGTLGVAGCRACGTLRFTAHPFPPDHAIPILESR
jgi:hypothetical protein